MVIIHPITAKQLARLAEERQYFRNEDSVAEGLRKSGAEGIEALKVAREELAEHILSEHINVNRDDPESVAHFTKMQTLYPDAREAAPDFSHVMTERYDDQKVAYIERLHAELRVPKAVLEDQFDQDETVMRNIIVRILDGRIQPKEVTTKRLVRWNDKEDIEPDALDETIHNLDLLLANRQQLLTGRGAGLDRAIGDFLQEVRRLRHAPGGDGAHTPMPHNGHSHAPKYNIKTMDGEELLNLAIDRHDHPLRISKVIRKGSAAETALRTAREDLAYSLLASVQQEIITSGATTRKTKLASVDAALPDVPEFGLQDSDSVLPSAEQFHKKMGHVYSAYVNMLKYDSGISDDSVDRQFQHDYLRLRHTIKDIIAHKVQSADSARLKVTTHILDALVSHVAALRTSGHLSYEALGAADTLLERLPAVRPVLEKIEIGQNRHHASKR